MSEIEKYADEKVFMFLVGNKSDLEERRKVSYDEGHQLASSLKIQFFETSAKSAKGVRQMFDTAAATVLRSGNIKLNKPSTSAHNLQKLLKNKDEENKNKCCA